MAYAHSSFLFIVYFVSFFASSAGHGASQSLKNRSDFLGGWSLAAQICPAGSTQCGSLGKSGYCCPSNTVCRNFSLGGAWACCPDTSNCSPTVKSFPVCADPTWTLYKGKANYFCCLANEVGILPARNAGRVGLCVASDMSLAMTQSATKVTSPTGHPTSSGSAQTISHSPSSTSAPSVRASSASTTTSTTSTSTSTTASTSTSKAVANMVLVEDAIVGAVGAIGSYLLVIFI